MANVGLYVILTFGRQSTRRVLPFERSARDARAAESLVVSHSEAEAAAANCGGRGSVERDQVDATTEVLSDTHSI